MINIVKIVIPIYKAEISELEMISLKQAYSVLHSYPLIVIKPASLDLNKLLEEFPRLQVISFPDYYFEGIEGYNKLMLSREFYASFFDCEYILIYQLDAYVFRDELAIWCEKGYDYIGGPWLKKKVYSYPVVSWLFYFQHLMKIVRGKPSKRDLYNRVGNGGFSLRKVKSHYQAIVRHEDKINEYLSHKRYHLYNEDVFWAIEIPEFTYPEVKEAIHFSFDKYPRYCYKLAGKRLPFGCHGWYKRKMKRFWRPIIGF